ncbi:uncharacterized protein LOC107869477 [Capsicum annuum]|uniref:uncharacterized protein LOC107869477 n=1 Tax=Capsicum annuum TaxID=4072 RepID=UPI001FB10713|nr:uncharacterized protein LOC107869477 [Capsicum annuum]
MLPQLLIFHILSFYSFTVKKVIKSLLQELYQMLGCTVYHLLSLAVLLLLVPIDGNSQTETSTAGRIKSVVFHSPKFVLKPGSVANNFYYNIDLPKGHIAVKDFYAEVVDEAGHSVPLSQVYLHHWVVVRYNQRKDNLSEIIANGNSGMCDDGVLIQHFALGSETRKTSTYIPDPYAIEIGNPADVPEGYQEGWLINLHAIDTRGTEDRFGCIGCSCHLYNITKDEIGRDIEPDYFGGLKCCRDKTRCRLKEGFKGPKKAYYLKYTVKYVDWDVASVVPLKVYIFDVTDSWKKPENPTAVEKHQCQIEYQVESCSADESVRGCTHARNITVPFPVDGDVIYGVAHQHRGSIRSTLHGEDGRIICSSKPIYGKGRSPGNEAGYVVGMTTCYPKPGSIKIRKGEMVTFVANYSSVKRIGGVMGVFYILVAETSPKPEFVLNSTVGLRL